MTFIFEDKLLVDLLLKYAQVQPQQYVAVSPEDVTAMRGLVANLEKQLSSGPVPGPEITTGSGQAAKLDSTNMKNLSALVNWLGMNGIKVDGKNVVVGSNDLPNDPSYIPMRFEGDQTFRPSTTLTFKVNKDLLTQYLQTLKAQLASNPNPVMSAQLDAIAGEANEQLHVDINKEPAAARLDPGHQLDSLSRDVRTDNPYVESNDVPLTAGDIASDTAFNAWIQKNNVGVNGRAWRHPQYDKCGLVKVLFLRAKSYMGNATSDQNKTVYTMYADSVSKLGNALQCDLSDRKDEKGSTDQQPSGGGTGGGDSPAVIMQLAQILPLALQDIDFTRIGNFLDMYEKVLASNTDSRRANQIATVSTAIQQARKFMAQAQRMTLNGNMTNFPLSGLTAGDLVEWSTPPQTPGQAPRNRGSAKALADFLDYAVRNTLSVVKNFEQSYVSDVRGQQIFAQEPQLRNAVAGQTGVALSNLNYLGAAKERLPQVGI